LVPESSTENTAQTITALQAKIRGYESKIVTLEQQNSNYKIGWDSTKAERDVKDSERNEALNKLSEADKQLLILRQKLSSAKTCTDMAAKNANDAKTELATSIASKAKLAGELSNVRAELDKCSKEKAEAITQKQAADAMSDLFKKNLENTKSKLQASEADLEKKIQEKTVELLDKVKSASEEKMELEKKIREQEATLKLQLEAAEKVSAHLLLPIIQQANSRKQAAREQIKTLEQNIQALKSELDDTRKSSASSSEEIASLNTEKEKLAQELAELKDEKKEFQDKIQQVCTNLEFSATPKSDISPQQSNLQKDLVKRKTDDSKRIEELESQIANRLDEAVSEELKIQVAALKTESSKLSEDLKIAQDKVLETTKSSKHANAQLRESSGEKSALKSRNTELQNEVSRLKDSSARSKVEVDVLKGEIKSLKAVHSNDTQKLARLSEADAEILQLKDDLESANTTHLEDLEKSARLSDTEAHVAQLEKQLEALSTARQADSEKLQRLSEAEARVIQLDNQVQQSSKDLAAKACELEQVSSEKDDLAEELNIVEVRLEIGENLESQTKLKIEILEKELEKAKAVKVATVAQPPPRSELVNESTQTDVTIDATSETQITLAQHLLITPPPSPAKDDTSETQVSDAPAIPIPPPVLKYDASTQTANKLKRSNIRLGLILFFSTIFAGFLIYQGLLSAYSSSSEVDISLNLTPPNGSAWDPSNALVGNTHSSNDTYSAETITANPFYQLPLESPKAVIEMPTSGLISHISSEFAPTCDPSSRPGVFALMDPFNVQLSSSDDESTPQSILFSYFHAGLRLPLCTCRAVFTDTEITFVDCLFGSS